jgi:hypothetical protein
MAIALYRLQVKYRFVHELYPGVSEPDSGSRGLLKTMRSSREIELSMSLSTTLQKIVL